MFGTANTETICKANTETICLKRCEIPLHTGHASVVLLPAATIYILAHHVGAMRACWNDVAITLTLERKQPCHAKTHYRKTRAS